MGNPLVSVVIPAFNAGRFITDAIGSVAAQTYRPLEILVADDGSIDNTRSEVERFRVRLPEVRWIEAAGHASRPSVPRNRGLAAASGELIAFLDADDRWRPHKLADQVSAMLRHPHLVLVYSMLRTFGPAAHFCGPAFGLKPWPTRAAVDRRTLELANTVPCSAVLARRSVIEQVGGFDEDPKLTAVEDYDLWLRISDAGAMGFIPRIHGYYRVLDTSISSDKAGQMERVRYLMRKQHLTRFTYREFARRPLPLRCLRSAADLPMTALSLGRESFERAIGVEAPLLTSACDESRSAG